MEFIFHRQFYKFIFCNTVMINFNKLPNVDLFASGFTGGASGYPLMYDNFEKDQMSMKIIENFYLKKTIMLKKLTLNIFYLMPVFENKLQRNAKLNK